MQYIPSEEDIQRVMEGTKMDYVQAYRHIKQREEIRIQLRQGVRGPVFRVVSNGERKTTG